MEFTAKQLAQILKGTVDGDENATATRFSKIEHGKPGSLCFFANPKYEQYVYTSKATIILVNNDFQPKESVGATLIRVENAYTAIADLLKYVSSKKRKTGRHRSLRARFYPTTRFGKDVYVGAFAVKIQPDERVFSEQQDRRSDDGAENAYHRLHSC